MDWDRIMNTTADSTCFHCSQDFIAISNSNRVDVKHMPSVRCLKRGDNGVYFPK